MSDPAGSGPSLLRVSELTTGYRRNVPVVHGASLAVAPREVVGVLGANGAGKTTLLRAITGSLPVWSGEVSLDGDRLNGTNPGAIARRGVGCGLEGRRIFTSLSVEENLLLPLDRSTPDPADRLDEVYQVLPDLRRHRNHSGGALSGGQQQMLAIGRALVTRPRLLILDEPSLGLSPRYVEEIISLLGSVVDRFGLGLLLAEQTLWLTRDLASTVHLMDRGRLGPPMAMDQLDTAHVVSTYLGGALAEGSER